MRHTATTLALTALLAACLLGGCLEGSTSAASQTAVVDLERIMSQSRAAEAGRAHLAQARQRLEQGFANLQKAWAKAPDKEREAVLRDGALTLRRQMAAEEAAVQNVVNGLLLEEVKAWRKAHKAALVLPRQNVLDADASLDITAAILKGMDARKAVFPALPVVSVKLPGEKGKTPETPGQANHNAAPGAKRK